MMKSIYLNQLSLQQSYQWPLLVKIVSIIFIQVLILFSGYWFVLKDHVEQWAVLQLQETHLKSSFESKDKQRLDLQDYQGQLYALQEGFNRILKELSTKNEIPGLLEDISKTGAATGLRFELFTLLPELNHDFYIELPIKTKITGSYKQLALFLSRMALMSKIINIGDFSIRVLAEDELLIDSDIRIYKLGAS